MTGSLETFAAAAALVFLAEMGDKTQLISLGFAAKYGAWRVLAGVTIGTLIVHSLSVALGRFIGGIIPFGYVTVLAGVAFIVFGLWTLRLQPAGDPAPGGDGRLGPVLAVALAFFVAELGDKTQLAVISLAMRYRSFIPMLVGAVAGMVAADGLAIALGTVAGKRLPERITKIVSGAVFILFGVVTLVQAAL